MLVVNVLGLPNTEEIPLRERTDSAAILYFVSGPFGAEPVRRRGGACSIEHSHNSFGLPFRFRDQVGDSVTWLDEMSK